MWNDNVGKASCASLMAATLLLQPFALYAQDANMESTVSVKKSVVVAPKSSDEVAKLTTKIEDEPTLTQEEIFALLQKKVKYVFVLFQENRSFDFYFGTYPGAHGLFSQSASETPGFVQPIVKMDGTVGTISPFLIPQSIEASGGNSVLLYPEDTDSVNHSQAGIAAKLDLDASHVAHNDRYAVTEEGLAGTLNPDGTAYTGPMPTEQQVQKGELVVGHVDCDTAPFLWNYADRFTLFDEFYDTVIGPSTPNAIAMIAGQSGVTQWIKHPELGNNVNATGAALPLVGDPQPFWGSALDVLTPPSELQPTEGGVPHDLVTNPSSNLTFASLPLSFMGRDIHSITAKDNNPTMDLQDVQADIEKIAGDGNKPVNWAWYQEGYDLESTDTGGVASHENYIAHHDAPQYFGYEANNPRETKKHLKGLGDFYTAVATESLPAGGGVFYVRGGYGNLDSLTPRSPSPAVEKNFPGNDDHPGYSDAQISEALLADSVNAIAASKYWKDSAIIITYDETDGLYDHTQPTIRSFDPSGVALSQGPRIPTIVISPYGRVHAISHAVSEHGSIIKFIDRLYNLTRLAELPDEKSAQEIGLAKYGQKHLDPSDGRDTVISSLVNGFDTGRLLGTVKPIPASFAMIPTDQVTSLPHFGGQGCRALQITPTDKTTGTLLDPAPADFNPRPTTNPGVPATTPGWPTN